MGFMDGLLDVLSGPMAVKQIDQHGFDFREKRAQDEAARQQQRQQWDQANEDYATKAMSEAAIGGMPEEELGAMLPESLDQSRRRAAINRALGQSAQAKSSLAAQKAQSDYYLQAGKDAASMERERYKGELRARLLKEAEELRARQDISPRDKALGLMRLQAQMQLFEAGEEGRNYRAGLGTFRPVLGNSGTITGYFNTRSGAFQEAPEGVEGGRVAGVPASMQEANALGAGIQSQSEDIKAKFDKNPEWVGPEAALTYRARSAKIPGKSMLIDPPTQEQAAFVSNLAGMKNRTIKEITGAQMSEHEVPRLMEEIPLLDDYAPVFAAKLETYNKRMSIVRAVRMGLIPRDVGIQMINSASGSPQGQPLTPERPDSQPKTLKPGDVYKGMRYKGGPKGSPSSWERP